LTNYYNKKRKQKKNKKTDKDAKYTLE